MQAPFAEKYSKKKHEESYDDIQELADKMFQYFATLDAPASIEQ